MKKLITICLLITISLMVNAQTEKLNKEQTIAYIDGLWSRTSLVAATGPWKASFYMPNKNTLKSSVDFFSEKRNEQIYHSVLYIPAYGNPIVRVFTFKDGDNLDTIGIKCDENDLFSRISNYSDANLLKAALEHLFKLFNDEGK